MQAHVVGDNGARPLLSCDSTPLRLESDARNLPVVLCYPSRYLNSNSYRWRQNILVENQKQGLQPRGAHVMPHRRKKEMLHTTCRK